MNNVITETLTLLEHQFKTARIKVQEDLYQGLPASTATRESCSKFS